jgi:hypothetical protein
MGVAPNSIGVKEVELLWEHLMHSLKILDNDKSVIHNSPLLYHRASWSPCFGRRGFIHCRVSASCGGGDCRLADVASVLPPV